VSAPEGADITAVQATIKKDNRTCTKNQEWVFDIEVEF